MYDLLLHFKRWMGIGRLVRKSMATMHDLNSWEHRCSGVPLCLMETFVLYRLWKFITRGMGPFHEVMHACTRIIVHLQVLGYVKLSSRWDCFRASPNSASAMDYLPAISLAISFTFCPRQRNQRPGTLGT